MIGIEQYQKIQEYKELGLAQTKTVKALGLTYTSVSKYWNMSKEDYAMEAEQEKHHMDNYRQYILEQLKICPQIRDTNIYLKLMEAFPDLQVKRATFYRYMKALREQHGYQHTSKRKISPREVSPPGYEAQTDFGQYKLKDMYGRIVRVYFFCMVLSYSRMKFVCFSPDPFTTETAIKAHNYTFQYFGGRPQTILYDLDRVYVVSENLGNIIFVPAFEEYVKRIGYSVSLCRPRDPQSKGKVEEVIGYVKQSFLEGRVYTGIDSLNSAALAWLDREGNGRVHTVTRKVPREMFIEEQKQLFHVKPYSEVSSTVASFDSNGVVSYKGNRYQIDVGVMDAHQRIRIEDDGEILLFYDTDTNELLAKYPVTEGTGQIFKPEGNNNRNRVSHALIKQYFAEHEIAQEFIQRMEQEQPKYFNSHCIRLNRMTKFYSMERMLDGIRYCIETERCNAYELLAYMMYKHGEHIAKKFLPNQQYFNHLTRSKEIRGKSMADITEIRELAKKLNLWNIARGYIDLNDEKLSNLDYLQMILQKELEIRARQKQIKLRRASKLPNKVFELSNLNKGLEWQIKQLSHMTWLNEEQNIILLGKCGTGKTSLAVHLGETVIDKGHKTYYASIDTFVSIVENKDINPKAGATFSYMRECDLIIIDDVFYLEPTRSELQAFYRAVTFLNETRSIIFITNREISTWLDVVEDKHLCQTLLDRITANCQIIRLTDR